MHVKYFTTCPLDLIDMHEELVVMANALGDRGHWDIVVKATRITPPEANTAE